MKNHSQLPRNIYLIALLVALIMGLASACDQAPKATQITLEPSATSLPPSETPTAKPSSTSSPTQPPTATATEIDTPTPTNTPTPTCLRILTPLDGAQFPETGQVRFEWEPSAVARIYRLEIIMPDGSMVTFKTFMTKADYYLFMLPEGGMYSWQVAALGPFGETVCMAGPFVFNKTASSITPVPEKQDLRWRTSKKKSGCG